MLTDRNGFVKLMVKVLELDLPAEAKIIYSVLADRISYSNYKDENGCYFFLSNKEKKELLPLVPCKKDSFKKYMRLLRERDLLITKQYGTGTRIYLGSRWVKKYTTDDEVVEKIPHQEGEKIPHQEGEKIPHLLNQEIKPDELKQDNMTDISFTCPKFVEILAYWRKNNYQSNPVNFFVYYDDKEWMIGGKPVRSWERLADKWEERQF